VVNDITSLKFHSGDRKNCYRTKLALEQAHFAEKIQHDPDFRYREIMKSLAFRQMGIKAPYIPLPPKPENAPEGWLIEQWRINRGLEPMLGIKREECDATLPDQEEGPVKILPDDSVLIINDDQQVYRKHKHYLSSTKILSLFSRISQTFKKKVGSALSL